VGHLETEKGKTLKFRNHRWWWWTLPTYLDLAMPFAYALVTAVVYYIWYTDTMFIAIGVACFCVMLAIRVHTYWNDKKPRCGRWWCVAPGTLMDFEVSNSAPEVTEEVQQASVKVDAIMACAFHMPWAFGKQSESYIRHLMLNGQYKSKGSVTFEQKEGVKE
jgi:hypothetical protein